jgi:hypothetical protein
MLAGESDNDAGIVKAAAATLFVATVVATLYFGREVLAPVALAIILSFVLAPRRTACGCEHASRRPRRRGRRVDHAALRGCP